MRKIKKIEQRLKVLECLVDTGHQYVFTGTVFFLWKGLRNLHPYVFKCRLCGDVINKSDAELTDAEQTYLKSVGIIDYGPKIPNVKTPKEAETEPSIVNSQ